MAVLSGEAPERFERLPLVRLVRRGRKTELELVEMDVHWVRECLARTLIYRKGRKVGDGQHYTDHGDFLSALDTALDIVKQTARAFLCDPTSRHGVEMRIVVSCSDVPTLVDRSPLPGGLFRYDEERFLAWHASGDARQRSKIWFPPLKAVVVPETLVWSSSRTDCENSSVTSDFRLAARSSQTAPTFAALSAAGDLLAEHDSEAAARPGW